MMFVDEAGPQITPIRCFHAWGCHAAGAEDLVLAAVWAVLIAGALIMPRWRDMFLVALVAFATMVLGEWAATFWVYGELPHFVNEYAELLPGAYGVLLVLAAAVHGLKRAVLWVAGYRTAIA